MKNHTLIFFLLASIMTACHCLDISFEVTTQSASLKEGSCIELTLTSKRGLHGLPANWFWMKNAHWSPSWNKFVGMVILSSNTSVWPIHPDFVGRIEIQGSTPSHWHNGTSMMSLMCNITQSDTGGYSFIYQPTKGSPWEEASTFVKVEDNPCLIGFVQPDTITVTSHGVLVYCYSLSNTCPLKKQLLDDDLRLPILYGGKRLVIKVENKWQNDGKKIACQTQGNTDKYLRRYITLNMAYSPKIVNVSFPEGVTFVREGKRMMLICTANGNPAPKFEWFKNGESVMRGAHFYVPSVGIEHEGDYKCVATNDWGSNESTLAVDVKYPPTVEISSSGGTRLKKGDNWTLSCLVKRGNPWPDTFTWYKDDRPIATQEDPLYIESPVLPEHKGRYKCVAYNTTYRDMYATSAQLLIDVQYPPRNTSVSIMGSSSTEVKAGTSVTLQCTADANPEPYEYAWKLFSQDGRLLETLSENTEHLQLSEVRPSDRFCYMCNATNALDEGDVSERLCIKVLYGPTNLELFMPDKVTEGETVSVGCSAESVPLSRLTLTWSARDQSSMGSVATVLSEMALNNVLLYVFEATWTDGGVYTCEASNTEGRGSTQKILEVTYAPRNVSVKGNLSLVVTKNTTLTLQCDADSNPPIKSVIWWKDSLYQNGTNKQALIVTPVTTDHAGIYSCTANNELGWATSPPVKVEVHIAPPEPVLSMATKVAEGELVSMLCWVESDLLANLTLTRVSSETSSEWPGASSHGDAVQNNTLSHTFNATSADSGVYICEADNGFGIGSVQKTLQVTYAPKDVTVTSQTSLVVAENATLVLQCDADSNPPVESVMWWKANDATPQNFSGGHNLTITSFAPADAGLYGCTATNEVGSASSPPVEVKMQNLNELVAIDVVWLLKYLAAVCTILILVFIFIFMWRMKRRCKGVSFVKTKNTDNTAGKFSYSMINLFSAGKDIGHPSATNKVQEEPAKENPLPDSSLQDQHGKCAMLAIPKGKQVKKGTYVSIAAQAECE
ncbi:cell adhesion molecule CEACAM5-like [Festucalex cinctus]